MLPSRDSAPKSNLQLIEDTQFLINKYLPKILANGELWTFKTYCFQKLFWCQ